MKQLGLSDLNKVTGGASGGGVELPDLPPKKVNSGYSDGSYQPATLPVEPDEG